MSKKVVLKLQIHDKKEKQKAMKAVSSLSGIESLSMDMKDQKLTVIGDVDPVEVVSKLRRSWPHTEILTVGPAKEEKKDDDGKKKDDDQKKKSESEQIAELVKIYKNYNPYYTQYYHVYSAEENPNSCVIS